MTDTRQADGTGAPMPAPAGNSADTTAIPAPAGRPGGPVDRFDRWVDDRVAECLRGNAVADRVFYTASALGDHGLVWLILADLHALASPDGVRGCLRTAGALGAESIVVNGPIKWVFRRQRPDLRGETPLPLRTPRTSSFPSGHASSAFCAALLMSDVDPGRRVAYYLIAAIVAWSRVHVRLHHASDVLGGAVVGTLLGVAVRRFVPLRPQVGPASS